MHPPRSRARPCSNVRQTGLNATPSRFVVRSCEKIKSQTEGLLHEVGERIVIFVEQAFTPALFRPIG
jgi:hypothetical protein